MRKCSNCRIEKDESFFYPVPVGDGISRQCKECKKLYERVRRKEHPEIYREYELRSHFNLSVEQYNTMFTEQNGLCFICHKPETVFRKGSTLPLTVDHNHSCCPSSTSCGKCVRHLLCFRCNSGLGYFMDNPELLIAAASYIKACN